MKLMLRKFIATTAIVAGLSGGALAIGLGAGTASANCPGCAPPAPTKYIPVLQGPGIPRY